jgi:hypothetical protein
MQNFEVQYTVRIYDPSLISKIAKQYESEAGKYRNKNEFFTDVIELGLDAKSKKTAAAKEPRDEKDDLYALLLKVFDYVSKQFKTLYAKETALERLLCAVYNIAAALNNGETLFAEKIESGFYDDLPARFEKILADIMKNLGLSDKE